MPLYDYACRACGRTTEILQRFDDPPLAICPHCGGELKKLLSAPAFHLKGNGWYVTDYARKGGGGGGKSSGEGSTGESSGKGDAGASGGNSDPGGGKGGEGSAPAAKPKPGSSD
jgi:putative FmdB family regulatory protein